MVTSRQLRPVVPPLRFFVDSGVGDTAQLSNRGSVQSDRTRRDLRARRFVHERHELVWKSRHRAPDADAAHVWTTTNAGHPTAFRHVAVHHRTPAAELHETFWRAILACEFTFFVITAAVAAFVHSLAEQPRRPSFLVEWNHRRESGGDVKQVKNCSMKLSGWTGQPGTLTMGMPADDFQSQPR